MAAEWVLGQAQRPPWDAIDWAVDQDWDSRPAADDPPASLYGGWRDAGLPGLRYVLVNMMEEYAWHNGRADLTREAIDGLTGQDPPE